MDLCSLRIQIYADRLGRAYQRVPGRPVFLFFEREAAVGVLVKELPQEGSALEKGLVHSIETFGSVDGPGVRFVIFLQGCRMRCRYCHNVDTWAETSDAAVFYTADELIGKAWRYRTYWGNPEDPARGGITVSGGEPLLQIDFLTELFRKAKARGIHTCIDTAGEPFTRDGAFFDSFRELLKYTDLLLVDIKHIDPERHRWLTGKDNANILDLLKFLDSIGKPVWIRHVLVPGVTDVDRYLLQTRAFLDTLSNVERIEVLPYHTMAIFKWDRLGIPYTLRDTEPPTQECIDHAVRILTGKGVKR